MRLEVGKSYLVRSPEWVKSRGHNPVVRIIQWNPLLERPYYGDDGFRYKEDGRAWPRGKEVEYDLVKEVTP